MRSRPFSTWGPRLLIVATATLAGIARGQIQEPPRQSDPQPREIVMDDIQASTFQGANSRDLAIKEAVRNRTIELPPNTLFALECTTCHGKIPAAPTVEHLRSLTPEHVYEALTTGVMKNMATEVTDEDKRGIAQFLTGRPVGNIELNVAITNRCTSDHTSAPPFEETSWSGWSPDFTNTRFQDTAGITDTTASKLMQKWAFAAPGATSMYAEPVIYRNRVYIGDGTGHLYALDAATGCAYWVFAAQSYSRGAPTIGRVAGEDVLFFGDVGGNGYALDASNGKLLWIHHLDAQPLTRVSGSPQYFEGRVYFPVAALEEVSANGTTQPCCTTRGAVVALDAATGEQLWKTYSIPTAAIRLDHLAKGRQFWGPAGASVWATPTIDSRRRRLYFVTGNLFAPPDTGDADSIQALDLDTGRRLWRRQAYRNDIFAGSIISTGPDYDFAASPILVNVGGRDLLIAGEKSGDVWALNPDSGDVVWHHDINPRNDGAVTTRSTEIIFGGAADKTAVYYGMRSGGIVALDLVTGEEKWRREVPPLAPALPQMPGRRSGISAAVSVIPGVLFTGGLDGALRAFSTQGGAPLWVFDTLAPLHPVNGVPAQGGSIGNPGPVIAQGMLFVTSGYVGYQDGQGGNLLIAFGPE